jgi:carbon storage regulator
MLILTRNSQQSIVIGDDIVVTVKQLKGNQVQFAIDAPKEINIIREELNPTHPALHKSPSY